MLKIIEVIKDANEKDCPLPALALALTLPDICSQIEYPDEKNVGIVTEIGMTIMLSMTGKQKKCLRIDYQLITIVIITFINLMAMFVIN